MTIFSVLPFLPIVTALLWGLFPAKQKPRWADFLPAAALVLALLDILVDGFQAALLGVYAFSLILFLANLGRLVRGSKQPPRRSFWTVLGGLLSLVLLALCLLLPILFPFKYDPTPPTGPYSVGTAIYGWEDRTRLETYTEDPADYRKIAVQFWYPADAAGGQKSASAVENAPLSSSQEKYPLVVFSHGAFGIRSSNTTTYMELASRGYIVASIDHTYHAFITRFPDGRSAMINQQFLNEVQRNQSGQMSQAESFKTSFDWMDLRTADIRFTLDQIQALNAGKLTAGSQILAGHIDEAKIGLFGHSLGGAASAGVCRVDARCKAVIVVDATMFSEYQRDPADGSLVKDPYPRPMMIFYNGDTYYATPDHLGYVPDLNAFNNAAEQAYSVVVNGAQHLNFTDLPDRAPVLARLLGRMMTVNGGTAGTISQQRCMEILDRYVVDFFNQTLLGEHAPLLNGQTPFKEVEFSVHTVK